MKILKFTNRELRWVSLLASVLLSVSLIPAAELSNLSARAWVEHDGKELVAGFVIEGEVGSTKRILIRAVGPELAKAPFNVGDAVLATSLILRNSTTDFVIKQNSGWSTSADASSIATLARELGAFNLSADSADSAMVVDLSPGVYTATLSPGGNEISGTALLELYDAEVGNGARLVNLSARALSKRASPLVAGFVTEGTDEGEVLIRAAGPALRQFLTGELDDPVLRLFDSVGLITDREDNWSLRPTSALTAAVSAQVGAFAFTPDSGDAALVTALAGGSLRTGMITSSQGGEGLALIEVYRVEAVLPQPPTELAVRANSPGQNEVVWNSVPGASIYELMIDGVTHCGVTSPFIHSGLAAGSTHSYAVRAVTPAGVGRSSENVSGRAMTEVAPSFLWGGSNQRQLPHQDTAQRQQQLQAMKNSGLKVLRLWVANRPDESWQIQPKGWNFESPVGVFHEEELLKLDRVMQECHALGIQVIIAFANHANSTRPDDVYFDTFGIRSLYDGEGLEAYKRRISYLLNRRNPYMNNKRWKDLHEVVMAWEVANESGLPLRNVPGSSAERYALHRNFLGQMAGQFKAEDPYTHVAAGIAGYARYYDNPDLNKFSSDDITILGNIPGIDIYTLHFYGGNMANWITDVLPSIRSWGKMLMIEEFGNERKDGMVKTIANYEAAIIPARQAGLPWLFWEMDLRKDGNTWGVMSDDLVWTQVIAPEAVAINAIATTDPWFR